MVTVGQTILNTISTDDPMAVDFLINEKQLADFEAIQNGKKAIDSLFTLLLPNNKLYGYTGKISVIDRAVDAQTGAIRVRLVFPNPKGELKVGMSCVVRVHNQDPAPQLLIPNKAIVEQMGEYFVFVVKDTIITRPDTAKKKEKVEKDTVPGPKFYVFQKKVMMGQTIDSNVIVKSGIEAGDSIVIDGVQLLHDGSRVALGNKKPHPDTEGTDKKENGTAGDNKKKGKSEPGDTGPSK
jgi:RND family efflux transporter MFP subunit